eukprot:TRINITY_DN15726_c0_g1_i1.p2 TRINITY_DN15726_c0_g1~~TRINITY_DN15726_c0_g1_i1.p2  ORF type:complete len:375 (-),score=89.40 TRINITY_DN15726_c0_g1_i1:110-1123(-)
MALPGVRRAVPASSRSGRRRAAAIAATVGCLTVALLPGVQSWQRKESQRPHLRGDGLEAFVPAAAAGAGLPLVADISAGSAIADWPQILLAADAAAEDEPSAASTFSRGDVPSASFEYPAGGFYTDASLGPDAFFYIYIITSVIIVIVALYLLSKPYFENRFLIDKINAQKLMLITREDQTTALDRTELARLYNKLRDYPAALGEFEEVEDEWPNTREEFDPDDAMGALAARAMMHNSKGYALANIEPVRTAQARKEFVRAVTFWPEYPEALLNIGRELIKRQRYDVAIRTLDTALKWQPASEVMQEAASLARDGLEQQEQKQAMEALEAEGDSDED